MLRLTPLSVYMVSSLYSNCCSFLDCWRQVWLGDTRAIDGIAMTNEEPTSLTKSLFAVQLEVTAKLLEAEHRKMEALKTELEAGPHIDSPSVMTGDSLERQQQNFGRLQMQYDRLNKEYQAAAASVFRKATQPQKSQRSVPALGMKQTAKARPSIFDSIASGQQPAKHSRRKPSYGGNSDGFFVSPTGSESSLTSDMPDDGDQKYLYYDSEGDLVSGTGDALIEHFIPTPSHYPDRVFIFAFLLCSRLFVKPYELLSRVLRTFHAQYEAYKSSHFNEEKNPGTNVVQLLSEWTETFAYDFRDERMMRSLKEITQLCATINVELRRNVGQVMQGLIKKLATLDKYEEMLSRANAAAAEKREMQSTRMNIMEMCTDPLILAQQLTHIEAERLCNIGPEEFVQTFSEEATADGTAFRDMKKTTNLEAYVEWFNRLTYLVATEICYVQSTKQRARVIEYFVDVARECYSFCNFNSFMAIVSGLNMTPVCRLKKTWAKVNTTDFDTFETHMNPSLNFSNYRTALAEAPSTGEDDKCVVPFFSLLVKDIYFLNYSTKSRLPDGQINFRKFWELAKIITQFLSWKQASCSFIRHKTILNYLMTIPVASEDRLYLASMDAEMPDSQFEKERHRALKQKLAGR